MTRLARLAWQTAGLLILALGGCAAPQQARPAETILADIDAVEWPEFNDARRDDEAVRTAYEAEYQRARDRAEALVLELYEADPDHERLAELIGLRWRTPPDDPQRTEQTRREVSKPPSTSWANASSASKPIAADSLPAGRSIAGRPAAFQHHTNARRGPQTKAKGDMK